MELSIVPMSEEDLAQVVEIERASFRFPWTKGMFRHELKIPFSRCRVVRPANRPQTLAGYVCWWVVGDEAEILNIAVAPSWRKKGIGRALVDIVVEDACRCGAVSVHLEVEPDNQPARLLYEGVGFRPSGLRRNYYARGVDAVTMTLKLASLEQSCRGQRLPFERNGDD